MENVSWILIIASCFIFIFSFWSFLLIKRHIKKFEKDRILSQGIDDKRYFELKANQQYIISSAAFLLAVIAILGWHSVNDVKEDLNSQFLTEKNKMDSLYRADTALSIHTAETLMKLNQMAFTTSTDFNTINKKDRKLNDSNDLHLS